MTDHHEAERYLYKTHLKKGFLFICRGYSTRHSGCLEGGTNRAGEIYEVCIVLYERVLFIERSCSFDAAQPWHPQPNQW